MVKKYLFFLAILVIFQGLVGLAHGQRLGNRTAPLSVLTSASADSIGDHRIAITNIHRKDADQDTALSNNRILVSALRDTTADLRNRAHNGLTGLQGGITTERYHLGSFQYNALRMNPYPDALTVGLGNGAVAFAGPGISAGYMIGIGHGAGIKSDSNSSECIFIGMGNFSNNSGTRHNYQNIIAIGHHAGYTNETGNGSVFIGNSTGGDHNSQGCLFLGNYAGYWVLGDSLFIIDNGVPYSPAERYKPLVFGRFNRHNRMFGVGGIFRAGTSLYLTGADSVFEAGTQSGYGYWKVLPRNGVYHMMGTMNSSNEGSFTGAVGYYFDNYVRSNLGDFTSIKVGAAGETITAIDTAKSGGGAEKGLQLTVAGQTYFVKKDTTQYSSFGDLLVNSSTWNGETIIGTAGEDMIVGHGCYLKSDGKWWRADADSAVTMPTMAIATTATAEDAKGIFLVKGRFRLDSWNWTIGGILFPSTTKGLFAQTAPSGAGDQVQAVGVATATNEVLFTPYPILVEK
jgi:hypothetical protein